MGAEKEQTADRTSLALRNGRSRWRRVQRYRGWRTILRQQRKTTPFQERNTSCPSPLTTTQSIPSLHATFSSAPSQIPVSASLRPRPLQRRLYPDAPLRPFPTQRGMRREETMTPGGGHRRGAGNSAERDRKGRRFGVKQGRNSPGRNEARHGVESKKESKEKEDIPQFQRLLGGSLDLASGGGALAEAARPHLVSRRKDRRRKGVTHPFLKRRETCFMYCMRPVPVVCRRFAFCPHSSAEKVTQR